jgi:hypothetical protein
MENVAPNQNRRVSNLENTKSESPRMAAVIIDTAITNVVKRMVC